MPFTPEIEQNMQKYRDKIELGLERYTDWGGECPARLKEAIRYSLLSGGKRLRPLLCLLACELCGGDAISAVPGACAVEMIHCYSLIHDDLPCMDDDDLRRGRPSSHIRFDEATAILAGDALQGFAFDVVCEHVRPLDLAGACCAALAKAAGPLGMVAGQIEDIRASQPEHEVPSGMEQLDWMRSIHARKTGCMIRVAMKIGALIAGTDAASIEAVERYGIHFGLGFQISDDILDRTGDEASMGKRVRKDAGKNKLTYPELIGLDASRYQAETAMNAARNAIERFSSPGNTGGFTAYETLVELTRYVLKRDA